MLKTLGIVQACLPPRRFHTHVRRTLGGESLLGFVVRRATDCQQLDGVIVVAGEGDDRSALGHLVPSDVPIFISDHADPMGRFAAAVEQYPTEAIVCIRGDSPFLDPALVDRLVVAAHSHGDCDYAGYGTRDGRPATESSVGVFAEWLRVKALRRALKTRGEGQSERLSDAVFANPKKFKTHLIPVPDRIDRDDVRLTVNMEEDWDNALAIFDALGHEQLEWQRIADLLDHQPVLRSRMAALNRAHGCR